MNMMMSHCECRTLEDRLLSPQLRLHFFLTFPFFFVTVILVHGDLIIYAVRNDIQRVNEGPEGGGEAQTRM